jgi:hypothetical protein
MLLNLDFRDIIYALHAGRYILEFCSHHQAAL